MNAAAYIAGIDEMIAANMRLSESIAATADEMKTLQAEAAGGAEMGATAGAAGATAGVTAEDAAAAKEAAAAQTELSDAERTAAEMAQLEKDMTASLAIEQGHLRDASIASADAQAKVAASAKLAGDANEAAATKTKTLNDSSMGALAGLGKLAVGGVAAAAVFTGYGVKSAADYQTQILRLKTSAGETGDLLGGKFTGNLKTVSDGILKLSVDTATSTKQLTGGMYMIESAGFQGAAGLNVLRAAAQGARAEGADLYTVGNALTTMMKDYHISASNAIPAMNQMIAVVAHGKTNMQDLASALHSVLPIAASAHLSFAQVGGAIATMTSHGVTADLATQHLANMIRNLIAPNNVAADAMAHLGINSLDLSKRVGDLDKGGRGLTGTLNVLMQAIMSHMGPSGLVMESTFNKSALAASSASTMIGAMPKSLQKVAQAFVNGKYTLSAWRNELKTLPTAQANLATQFASTVNKANGFTTSLKNNRGAAATADAELKKMTGGAVGLETILQLTGKNAIDFKNNVKAVGDAAHGTGKNVENWSQIQHTFNFQLAKLRQEVEVLAIKLGQELLPVLTKAMEAVSKFGGPALKEASKVIGLFWAGFTGSSKATQSGFTTVGEQIRAVADDLVRFGKDAFTAFKIVAPVVVGVAKVFGGEFLIALRIAGALLANVVGPALVLLAKVLKACKPEVEVLAALIGVKLVASLIRLGVQMTVGKIKAFASAVASTYRTIVGFPSAVISKIDAFGQKMSAAGDALRSVAGKVADVGKAAASGVASAARFAASWVASGAKLVASAAVWVAQSVAKVAVVVATNVAGAATTAAAWLVANAAMVAGILLVVLIIAGIVLVIIKYHKQIWSAIVKIWDDIKHAVLAAVSFIVDFVRKHWQLLLAILTGPIGLAVLLIKTYWSDIQRWFTDGVTAVETAVLWFVSLPAKFAAWMLGVAEAVGTGINDVISWFTSLPVKALKILIWFAGLAGMFARWLGNVTTAVGNGINNVVNWFASLGGKVLGAIGNAGNWLVQTGRNILIGLWNGISSLGSWLFGQIESFVNNTVLAPIHAILHIFSPSKHMHWVGQMIGQGLADGIRSMYGEVQHATTGLAQIITGTSPGRLGVAGGSLGGWGGAGAALAGSVVATGGGSGGLGGGGQSTVVNVTVQGTVVAQRDLERGIQQAVLQTNVRNPDNRYSLPSGR